MRAPDPPDDDTPWHRYGPAAAGAAGWLAVLVLAVGTVHTAVGDPSAGLDLRPVRAAGTALRTGHPIYGVPRFVYPPPAALVGWVESYLPVRTDVAVVTALEVLGVAATVLLFHRCLRPHRWSLPIGALVTVLLLEGDLLAGVLWLDNASVLLLVPCAVVLRLWGRGRWAAGAAVLAATFLVKPVLVALVAVPVAWRRWRTALLAVAVPAGVVGMAVVASGNLASALRIGVRLDGGSILVGRQSVYNLSLAGLRDRHHLDGTLVGLLRLAVVAGAALVVVRCARRRITVTPVTVGAAGALALSTVFLAGPLSEDHYLLLLLPGALAAADGSSRAARVLLAGALALAGYPSSILPAMGPVAHQVAYVGIELLVLVASALTLASTGPGTGTPRTGERADDALPSTAAEHTGPDGPVGPGDRSQTVGSTR